MYGAPMFQKASKADAYSDSEAESEENEAGGFDGGEFQPRKRRRMGKESAALGIFGDDSDDEDTRRPGQRWKQKTLRTQGMAFVSGGQCDDEYSEGSVDDQEDDREEDDEDEENDQNTSGFMRGGLGFSKASNDSKDDSDKEGGKEYDTFNTPSFTPASFKSGYRYKSKINSKSNLPKPKPAPDSNLPFGKGFVPSSAYAPVLRDDLPEDTPQAPAVPKSSAFSSGRKSKIGNSFAQRMMAKMGYVEGKGLGKESQGRNVVIEANLRPQGVGLGAVKEKSEQERKEERRQAALRGEKLEDDSENEEKKRRRGNKKMAATAALGRSSGSGMSTPRSKPKAKFLTAEDLRKTAPGLHIPTAFAPILDMTGPGEKTLTSTAGLMSGSFTPAAAPETPEVVAKRRLIKRAHADLAAFSEEWNTLVERKAWADKQLEEHERAMATLTLDLDRYVEFARIVQEELPQVCGWDDSLACLHKAASTGVLGDDMADVIVATIYPLMRDADWEPLLRPTRFATELLPLRDVLLPDNSDAVEKAGDSFDQSSTLGFQAGGGVYRRHHKATTAYESLMYKLWLPRVLATVRSWDAYDVSSMMALVDAWEPLLPGFVKGQFMAEIVRHLDTTLSDWNPQKLQKLQSSRSEKTTNPDSMKSQHSALPHVWLFPWLPLLPPYHLDPRGSGLVADVKRKFRRLIGAWDFSRGLVPGLDAWKAVLGKEWTSLVVGHVLPSMGRFLRSNFRVDPADQEPHLAALRGVMQWQKVLGAAALGQVVATQVFPLWHAKLDEWLAVDEVNLTEVADWFEWWDGSVYPAKVRAVKEVQEEFERGLSRMERGIDETLTKPV
ncbi:hypothetical protein TD95_004734 [Thielaviopsis punctulata]|uniref:G-patch domain-containing protein n=1 Tax=Thielaviopsis punctulata TaxID=72032 RepID=A0A0F4Z9N0_9PEZI|nr:hypothetical protein TD95_004734 [Thielaviopsis punctulata]